MEQKPVEELISEIAEKTGKPKEEINKLISEKTEKFSGLLTKQGAAFMVAKELGIKSQDAEEMKISELAEGMKDVEVKAKIEAVFPIKEFEKKGKKGKLRSVILGDGTGEIRLTLWNDQADKHDLTKGSEVTVSNGIISTYNGKKQLGLGYNGELEITKKAEQEFEKLSSLKGGMRGINVAGKILSIFPAKEFEKEERKGKVRNFQIGDETAILRATSWNEQADKIGNFHEGDTIELLNGYTKDGMFGVELHAGFATQIKASKKELPGIKEIMKDNLPEKKINELADKENTLLKGKITEISPGKLHYMVCEKCGKKVSEEDGGVVCENCGEVEADINAVVSLIIEDDTGKIRATMFGESALKAIGMKKDELKKELESKEADSIIKEKSEGVAEKEISVYGYAKENSYSGEREFMVKEIIE